MSNLRRSSVYWIAAAAVLVVVAALAWGMWLLLRDSQQPTQAQNTLQTAPAPASGSVIPLTASEKSWLKDHPVIRVAQDPAWPPVEYADSEGRPLGISNDYLDLVGQRLGIRFDKVTGLSWQAAYDRLKRWEIDMTTSVAVTQERLAFWEFTNPYLTIPIVIFAYFDVPYVGSLRELIGKRVAVVEGYVSGEWITRDYPEIELVEVPTVEDGLRLLQEKEVAAFVDNLLVAGYYMTKLRMSDVKVAGQTPYFNSQRMAVRKDWAPLAGILQKGLDSITESERAGIYLKWVPVQYEDGRGLGFLWWVVPLFVLVAGGLLLWNRRLFAEIRRRKSSEAALKTSEERFRTLAEESPVAIFVQVQDRFVYANSAALRLFGEAPSRPLLGESVADRFQLAFRDGERERAAHPSEMREHVPVVEDVIIRPTGERVDVEVSATPFVFGGENGELVFVSDVTDSRRAERLLRLTQFSVDRAADSVFWTDPMGGLVYVSDSTCRRLGYTHEELVTMTVFDVDPSLDLGRWSHSWEKMRREGSVTYETVHRTKEGVVFPVEVNINHVAYDGREFNCVFARDITDRKRVEADLRDRDEQLQQSQKMEAIGQLAGGIAHDFNNLLTAIIGYSDVILSDGEAQGLSLHQDVAEIRRAAERAGALTRQILAFSRRQALRPDVVSLNEVLDGMEPLLHRTLGEDIDLVSLKHADLGYAEIDVHQFEQVLMNLALNARDAMSSGGRLTLETANVDLDEEYCRAHAGATPGAYVMLAVSDTGMGMDEATLQHVFEPFFTTKAPGEGTGLGLAMVYGIVTQSRGNIFVYSEPGRGTSFKIYLPRVAQKETAEVVAVPDHPPRVGGETVVVVEDESALRSLIERVLNGAGYQVICFASADDAMAVMQKGWLTVDLLLTDVVLPGVMQGKDLVDVVRDSWPDVAIIYMSGYTRNAIVHSGRLDEGVNFLEKPFTPEALVRMVHQVLDQGSSA